jgi:hypothetical protein
MNATNPFLRALHCLTDENAIDFYSTYIAALITALIEFPFFCYESGKSLRNSVTPQATPPQPTIETTPTPSGDPWATPTLTWPSFVQQATMTTTPTPLLLLPGTADFRSLKQFAKSQRMKLPRNIKKHELISLLVA